MLRILLALTIATTWSLNVKATTTERSSEAYTRTTYFDSNTRNVYKCTACEELLKECNAVVGYCDDALNEHSKTIEMLEQQKRVLDRELGDARSELNSRKAWYKQPAFLITAGVLAGFLLSTQVSR